MTVNKNICKGPQFKKDKKYAWVTLAMSFLSHSVHLGFSYAVLGNLTIAHMQHFSIDLQLASLIGSVHSGVFFLFGMYFHCYVMGCGIVFNGGYQLAEVTTATILTLASLYNWYVVFIIIA